MIKNFFAVIAFAVLFTSCKKESNDCPYAESPKVAPTSEVMSLQSYVTTNDPAAVQHPSGFFYKKKTYPIIRISLLLKK